MSNRVLRYGVTLCLSCALSAPAAAQVDEAISKQSSRASQGAQAQDKIDAVHDQTRGIVADYKAIQKQIEGLETYLVQLDAQISDQTVELKTVRESIEDVTLIERQITPLMLRMIDSIEQFVALDTPFLRNERKARIEKLRSLMGRSDVTVAERFRNVLTAYEAEIEYGNTIEAYRGTLGSGGEAREVDYLRIGRLALFYQSLDGTENGRWNPERQAWDALPRSYSSQILRGIRIAREQAAPDLVRLPIETAEAVK